MRKISTMQRNGEKIFKGQLTIGLDLGDRSSAYCVLNEAGEIVLEHKLATTPEAMKQVFGSVPRCRIAMETGTHSPWVSRVLTALGHEVIVGHAQKVRLITKSRRKDDRLDARTLARLARIDPELLSPVKHRSAQAQLHLTEIRARAVLVSTRTALVNAARGLVKSYVVIVASYLLLLAIVPTNPFRPRQAEVPVLSQFYVPFADMPRCMSRAEVVQRLGAV